MILLSAKLRCLCHHQLRLAIDYTPTRHDDQGGCGSRGAHPWQTAAAAARMTGMRDINASTEVAGIVGEEDLARLRTGVAFARYTCWACGRPGLADTQPTSVVVELGEQAARVSLAHARCARSHVVDLRGAAVPAVAEDGGAD